MPGDLLLDRGSALGHSSWRMVRMSTRGFWRSVALPLALVLAVPSAAYAQEPMARAKELYDEGSTLYSAADYGGAIKKFTEALGIVTSEGSDDDHTIRGALLLNIAQSHTHAYEVDADAGHLRAARSIYQRYVDEAGRGAGYPETDVVDAKSQIDDLNARIEALEEHDDPPPNNGTTPPPTTPGDTGPAEAEIVRTRSIGIGLLVGGSVLTLGGVGLLAWGTTFERFAIQSVREEANDPDKPISEFTPEEREHVDEQTRFGKIWLGAGAGIAVLGLVGVGLGAWQMSKAAKMRKQRSAVLMPVFTRDFAGLSLTGRF